MKLIACNKNYRFLGFLVFSIPAGLMANLKIMSQGKNVKTCDITGIVPAATDYSFQSKTPRRKEKVWGVLMKNI